MRRATETRLARLVEARHKQDQRAVRESISRFLNGMTPVELYECREPQVLRPRLAAFLADQPARTLATIERWAAHRKGGA